MTQSPAPPSIGDVVAPILARVDEAQRPLLIASRRAPGRGALPELGERRPMAAHAARLLACADREEEIAGRVEALFPDAAAIQREICSRSIPISPT